MTVYFLVVLLLLSMIVNRNSAGKRIDVKEGTSADVPVVGLEMVSVFNWLAKQGKSLQN